MKTIGGSVFVRNAVKYDYCIMESIGSLLPLCDEIVVMDCQSDDGTAEMLSSYCANFPKISYHRDVTWECAPNYERLAILANQAISKLTTEWHFMIQADEVLHESAVPNIRQAIEELNDPMSTILIRRINLWGGMDTYIRHDLDVKRKPVSDAVVRIGRVGYNPAFGDGEGLQWGHCDTFRVMTIPLFHYGFVRKNEVEKVIDMQSWFHGPGSEPDIRVVEMKNKDGVFRPEVFFNKDELAPLEISHPIISKDWASDRRSMFENAYK